MPECTSDKAAPMMPCTVIDISDTGARLAIESNENIPAEFSIVLSPNGGPSRNCKIVWRTEDHVGVAFDADGPCRDKKWTTSESF